MRTISFNKLDETVLCIKCSKNPVPRRDWDKPCASCKKKAQKVRGNMAIGRRLPAAVLKDEDGNTTFVDKFGREVSDHGYDLENDPRGWERNGYVKKDKPAFI